jgi:hypothetical protein
MPDQERENPEESRVGLDRLRADEELQQAYVPRPDPIGVDPIDGLPRPMIEVHQPFAPPLSTSTLCCMANTSSFALRDSHGDVVLEIPASAVSRFPDGKWRASLAVLAEIIAGPESTEMVERMDDEQARTRVLSKAEAFAVRWLSSRGARIAPSVRELVEVEPIRPVCRHYARQLTDIQDDAETMFVARVCTARRDSGGEFLSLRDAAVFACDLREPYDQESSSRLDAFDEAKIELGKNRVKDQEAFDVDAALQKLQDDATPGGIFT